MKNFYLFTSKDEYLIKKKIDELLESNNLSEEILDLYDLEDGSIDDLLAQLNTVSIFDDLRIFWVKNPSFLESNKDITEEEIKGIESYVSNKENVNVLIFSSTNYESTNKLSTIINKYSERVNLDKENFNLSDYFNKYVMDNHLIIDEAMKEEIIFRSKDFQTLENNLMKLDCYANGNPITFDMINLLINKEVESKIYDISQALFDGNPQKAYVSLTNLLDENVSPSIILANLKNTITLLLYVSKLNSRGKSQFDIARELNISAGRAYHLIRYAKMLGDRKIENYIKQLCKINVDSRSGNGDERMMLELFILQK